MVFHDRAVYQQEHAAQLIMATRLDLHLKAEYICADLSFAFTFPLQSRGGPYISGMFAAKDQKLTIESW
jgi:hypothetical protein